jgi:hypothetical protein
MSKQRRQYLGGHSIERDPFRWRRLARAKRKTKEIMKKQAGLREMFAVDMAAYQQAESKLIKKSDSDGKNEEAE